MDWWISNVLKSASKRPLSNRFQASRDPPMEMASEGGLPSICLGGRTGGQENGEMMREAARRLLRGVSAARVSRAPPKRQQGPLGRTHRHWYQAGENKNRATLVAWLRQTGWLVSRWGAAPLAAAAKEDGMMRSKATAAAADAPPQPTAAGCYRLPTWPGSAQVTRICLASAGSATSQPRLG